MEREGGAVALLQGFEIVEEPTDVGKEEVADLELLVERRLDLGERVFQVPALVGKGKRRREEERTCCCRENGRMCSVVGIAISVNNKC